MMRVGKVQVKFQSSINECYLDSNLFLLTDLLVKFQIDLNLIPDDLYFYGKNLIVLFRTVLLITGTIFALIYRYLSFFNFRLNVV